MKKKIFKSIVMLSMALVAIACSNDKEDYFEEAVDNGNSGIESAENLNPEDYNWFEALEFEGGDDQKAYPPTEFTINIWCKEEFKQQLGNITDWQFFAVYDFDTSLWDVRDEVDPWVKLDIDSTTDEVDLGWGRIKKVVAEEEGSMPSLQVSIEDFEGEGQYAKIVVVCKIEGKNAFVGTVKVKKIPYAGCTTPYFCYHFSGHDAEISPNGEDFYLDVVVDDIPGVNITSPAEAPFGGSISKSYGAPNWYNGQSGDHLNFGWARVDRETIDGKTRIHVVVDENNSSYDRLLKFSFASSTRGEEVRLGVWPCIMLFTEELIFEQKRNK